MSLLNLFSLEKKDSNIDLGTTTIYSYLESVNILKLLIRLKELACELWIRKGYELRVEVFWLLHQNKSPLARCCTVCVHCSLFVLLQMQRTLTYGDQCCITQYNFSLCRHNNEKTFLIWINEEDHTRVISMEKGGNMKRVFERFCRGLKEVRLCLYMCKDLFRMLR